MDKKTHEALLGAYSLSGFTNPTNVVWFDPEDETSVSVIIGYIDGQNSIVALNAENANMDNICICGSVTSNPEIMTDTALSLPNSTIYALPQDIDLLAKIGRSNKMERPRRCLGIRKNTEPLEGYRSECLEFQDNLESDAIGNMAKAVMSGHPILNEIKTVEGVSRFYGDIISSSPISEDFTVLVDMESFGDLFPDLPLSYRYICQTTPCSVKATDSINKELGTNLDRVNIMCSSDFLDGTQTFMNFYRLMSGRRVVIMSKKEDVSFKRIILYRYDKAYKHYDIT